jgi:hypothetical protein
MNEEFFLPSWLNINNYNVVTYDISTYDISKTATLCCSKDYGCIDIQEKTTDEFREMKRHMSEMQTEINNLRATNQVLVKSFRDLIEEMKIMIQEKNNKE